MLTCTYWTAYLALHASLSDDFILFRANINWLDNPVVSISYINQCPIVSIANRICLLGSLIALELPLKWLLVAYIPKDSSEVGYLFFYTVYLHWFSTSSCSLKGRIACDKFYARATLRSCLLFTGSSVLLAVVVKHLHILPI